METIARKFQIYGLHLEGEPGRIRYVGQTRQGVEVRLKQHLMCRYPHLPIAKWVTKHGAGQIRLVVLEEVPHLSDLDDAEVRWVSHFRRAGLCDLNLTSGGNNGTERKFSVDHAARVSAGIKASMLSNPNKSRARLLSRGQAEHIWQAFQSDALGRPLDHARMIGVPSKAVHDVINGRMWNEVTGLARPLKGTKDSPVNRNSDEDLLSAYQAYVSGKSLRASTTGLNVSPTALFNAMKRGTHLHIGIESSLRSRSKKAHCDNLDSNEQETSW